MSSVVNGVRAPDGRAMVALGSIVALAGSNVGDERLDLVVAERPEELRRDHDGRRCRPRVHRLIECRNQVSPLASCAVKPGLAPDVSRAG